MEKKSTKNLNHSQSSLSRIPEEADVEVAQPLSKTRRNHNVTVIKQPIKEENEYYEDNGSNDALNHYETLSLTGLHSSQTQLHMANVAFSRQWNISKRLYLQIQLAFVSINFFLTMILLSISVWLNVDKRFMFLAHLANISYSSLNRIIGLLPLVSLLTFSISFCLDLCHIFLFIYVKRFLGSHDSKQIDRILTNQKLVFKLNYELKHLELRSRIRRQIKVVLTSLRTLTYMISGFYFGVVLSTQFFIGLFIHFNFDFIINYQLTSSIRKLCKEYEKKQIEQLHRMDSLLVRLRHVETKSVEEKLMDEMHTQFECCNYQNPYQLGELAPASCNYERGCLKPVQAFAWEFFYYWILLMLVTAAFKVLFQLVLWFNFRVLLCHKLINRLYEFNMREYEMTEQEENELEEQEKMKKEKRLKDIRDEKERQLREEEEEEARAEAKREEEYQRFLEQERRQDDYERMLERQHRFEELRLEKLKRKLQAEHQLTMSSTVHF
jgi:hypothetical protein